MNRHSAAEIGKNILIALLVVSALFFGWASRLFGNAPVKAGSLAEIWSAMSGPPAGGKAPQNTLAAAMPAAVVLTGSAGGHYGAKYDLGEVSHLYKKTVRIFSQALGSAQTPLKSGEPEWQRALGTLGIYYEYLSPVKLAVLACWFDTSILGDWGAIQVSRLCVIYSGGKNLLYFQDSATGGFYVAETMAQESIAGLVEAVGVNSALFVFEVRKKSPASYTLLLPEVTEYPVLLAKNPLADAAVLRDVLLNLGVSENIKASYTASGGTNYVGSNCTVRVTGDGTVYYNQTEGDDEASASPTSESDAIKLAYLKVSETIGKYCGEKTAASVCYSADRVLTGGGYQILFRYVAAGGAVVLHPVSTAASVTVRNGSIVNMELRFLSFTATGNTVALLPEIQAAAAADGDFMLGYEVRDTDNLEPFWVRLPLNS